MMLITRQQARNHRDHIEALLIGHGSLRRRNDGTRRVLLSLYDLRAYECLIAHNNWETGRCYPGLRAVARYMGTSSPSTSAASMRRLSAYGLITINQFEMRTPDGMRWFQCYTLHPSRLHRTVEEEERILAHRAPPLRRKVAGPMCTEFVRNLSEFLKLPAVSTDAPPPPPPESVGEVPVVVAPRARETAAPVPTRPRPSGRVRVWHENPRSAEEQIAIVRSWGQPQAPDGS